MGDNKLLKKCMYILHPSNNINTYIHNWTETCKWYYVITLRIVTYQKSRTENTLNVFHLFQFLIISTFFIIIDKFCEKSESQNTVSLIQEILRKFNFSLHFLSIICCMELQRLEYVFCFRNLIRGIYISAWNCFKKFL